MHITIVDGSPSDMNVGIQMAFLCVMIGGIVDGAVALALVRRCKSTHAGFQSTWHTPFTVALVLQVSSVMVAIPLIVGAAFLSMERWIPGLLLANVVWTVAGVEWWRRLRLVVGATEPPSIIEHRRAG